MRIKSKSSSSTGPAQYLITLSILQPDRDLFGLKYFPDHLVASAYSDPKKCNLLGQILSAISPLEPEFTHRLHQALSNPLSSDLVVQKLWDTCMKDGTPAVILAARNPTLMERLIDYVYISGPPSDSNLTPMRVRAVRLMGCLVSTTAEGFPEDVETLFDCCTSLFDLRTTLCRPFSEMLDEIETRTT